MITVAPGLSYVDVRFCGMPRVIATAVLHGPGGVALIDPGPSSTLPALRGGLEQAGVSFEDVRALVLTHIHLDHAGATGTLVREHPHLRVYVHERGAPHMIDPGRLLASAARLYGDDMERLWGEVRPVPQAAIVALRGEERISVGGRDLEVAYTPGHASHHVSYFSGDARIAFVGDTAGIRLIPNGFILPPTPPPDIDLERWHASLSRIGRWRPETLFVTHFGPHGGAAAHLAEMADRLEWIAGVAKASLAGEGTDDARESWFAEEIRRELRRRATLEDARAYEAAGPFTLSWRGLARYWRKRSIQN
jgi:glyoxylase-like metal-dependent hydrolase (beta-lactamase superfamily II)